MQGFACGLEFALQECAAPFEFSTVLYNSKDCGILFVGGHVEPILPPVGSVLIADCNTRDESLARI